MTPSTTPEPRQAGVWTDDTGRQVIGEERRLDLIADVERRANPDDGPHRNPWDTAREIADGLDEWEVRDLAREYLALAHFDRVPDYPSVGNEPKVRMDAIKKGDHVRLHGAVYEVPHDIDLPEGASDRHSVTLRVHPPGRPQAKPSVFAYSRHVRIPLVARPVQERA